MGKEVYEFLATPQMERYYNDDSTYGVYSFITTDDIPEYYNCKLDPFDDNSDSVKGGTLAGKMQQLSIGMEYKVTATMEYNTKYKSYNYVPTVVIANIPKTPEQQIAFLKTQVTELQAKNILEVYPNVVEDVMQNKPIDVSQIKGIGEITWKHIKEKILDNYVISDILSMLQPLGVTFAVIKKLITDEPNPSLLKQKLIENPYIMTRVKGLGFKKVDDLALKLNPDLRISEKRVIAFLRYHLNSIGEDLGHTWVTQNELDNAVQDNIYECFEVYQTFIDKEKTNPLFLYFKDDKVGMSTKRMSEMSILNILNDLNNYQSNFTIDIEKGIEEAEKEQGFEYTEEQKQHIRQLCQTNVNLLSGLAGTGKTTILRALLKIYKNYSLGCCALSAKAAQRITEATNCPASTIHRLLGFDLFGFRYNAQERLPYDVVVLDEASMVNVPIFLALVSAIKEGAKVIICGDDGQLPPIGYGNVFHDLLELNVFNACKLTKILRQAEKSGIIADSKKIRNNENPLKYPQLKVVTGELQDMTYMFRDNREGMRELALKLYFQTLQNENNSVDNTIIITPCKQARTNSTEELNKIIQNKLIPLSANSVKYGSKEFRVGAKVIQRANNYEKNVFNGEVGYITNISDYKKTKLITVNFGNKTIDFTLSDLTSLELAYALTIHVTQGSGYDNVIVIVDNTHFKLLDNCLLYTALTRAKKKCLLITEPSAYQRCIEHRASARNTWLSLESKTI